MTPLGFLDLVQRELSAVDARLEFGGRAPSESNIIWAPLQGDWRVVVIFDPMPTDPETARARLATLAETFVVAVPTFPDASRDRSFAMARRELDHALLALKEKAKAQRAFVIDSQSPMLWGDSSLENEQAPDDAIGRLRDLEANRHLPDRGTVQHGEQLMLHQRFANLYWLVLLFGSEYSELHAEGALLHGLPTIEKLVLDLPPIEPPPAGQGRLLPFKKKG